MKILLFSALLLAFGMHVSAQHETPMDFSTHEIKELTVYFYNQDSSLTVWAKIAGASATVPPLRMVRAGHVISIPQLGGYTLKLVNGKDRTVLANEAVPDGTAYFARSGNYVGVIRFDTAQKVWLLNIRTYNATKDGPLPK